jgi:hypothetical protein
MPFGLQFPTQRVINFIPRDRKGRRYIANWCPISFLSTLTVVEYLCHKWPRIYGAYESRKVLLSYIACNELFNWLKRDLTVLIISLYIHDIKSLAYDLWWDFRESPMPQHISKEERSGLNQNTIHYTEN